MSKNYKETDSLFKRLQGHSFSVHHKKMEPISLIVIGSKSHILTEFGIAGWYLADSINLSTSMKSAIATIFDSSYRNGPMWPSYVNGKKNQLGLQRPTRSDSYRRRHHLRLWRSALKYHKQPVWVGTISYDRSVGHYKNSLLPIHHISSKLNSEENFLARTFRIAKPHYVKISKPEKGFINTGDPYVWDGRALVLDLSK